MNEIQFPHPSEANPDGLLAMGGDLQPQTLINAYAKGIFPWFNDGQPILWWSPDPRMVLFPDEFKTSRSLKKSIRNRGFEITANRAFTRVMSECATRSQATAIDGLELEGSSTWINNDMKTAYARLHERGVAHSIEVWQNSKLVGGLYGVKLGKLFFGESMFSQARDASKVALYYLCRASEALNMQLVDCQIESDHLASLGARCVSRRRFLTYLDQPRGDVQHERALFQEVFEQLQLPLSL